jgi:hypothetical protein
VDRVDGLVRNAWIFSKDIIPETTPSFELDASGSRKCANLFRTSRQICDESRSVYVRKFYGQTELMIHGTSEFQNFARTVKGNTDVKGHWFDFLHVVEPILGPSKVRDAIEATLKDWMHVINAFLRGYGKSVISIENLQADPYKPLARAKDLMIGQVNSWCIRHSWNKDYAVEYAQIHHSSGWRVDLRIGKAGPRTWVVQLDGDIGYLSGLWQRDEDESGGGNEDELDSLNDRIPTWMSDLNLEENIDSKEESQ